MVDGWLYEGKEFTDPGSAMGFVYIITNKVSGKRYIGKKLFTKAGSKQVNKKRKKIRLPSDWENYFGSSPALLKDVEALGPECFDRKILYLCSTRGECNYIEAALQFQLRVLEQPDLFYNENIYCRIHRSHIAKSGVQFNQDVIL